MNAATDPAQDRNLCLQRRAEGVVPEHDLVPADRKREPEHGRLTELMKVRAADLDRGAWVGSDLEQTERLRLDTRRRARTLRRARCSARARARARCSGRARAMAVRGFLALLRRNTGNGRRTRRPRQCLRWL